MSTLVLSASSLLSFAIEPDPDPLTVSTAAQPVTGRLDITVGPGNSGPAFCKSVKVRIPIGAGAAQLTENRTALTSAVTGATGWTARPGYADGTWQVFEFTTDRPVNVTDRAATLVISQIEVNKTAGSADIEIIEETSPTNGSFTAKTTAADVQKFPAEFAFRNFRPAKIMVANGERAVLRWDGSTGATYTMYWGRSSQDVTSVREWSTPEPLTEPTGFMLQASVTTGGQTLVHTLTTVVMVERPDLDTGKLDVWGRADFHGDISLMEIAPARPFHEIAPGGPAYEFTAAASGFITVHGRAILSPRWEATASVRSGEIFAEAYMRYDGTTNRLSAGATATCPIVKGTRVRLSFSHVAGVTDGAARFWWIPLGNAQSPVA
ncbi:hypothetical protein [Kitasatospora sp. NPDC056731]|uniref:hypothetical protein n=1 Tax=Kitasatospora sp. NPDC056731 TaxID=3155422 RepID=UPI00342EEE10